MEADEDLKAIEAVVKDYLDGLWENDADKLARVFHPTAAMTQWFDGKLAITPVVDWFPIVRQRAAAGQPPRPRHDHVLAIDIVGPTMVLAKVKCAIPPRFFTDLLSLLKIEGRWQVAQKVFMTELRG